MRRFEREARATAALTSPHTVQLYDFGVTEDGRLYYVMELLAGLDLDTLVKLHGPLPAERVVHLLRQVCAALQDAHGNGLVHRDIKPANVMVSRAGTTFDFVKVLDFGLVRLDSARVAGKDAINLSTEDSWSGTPGYMAPEVVLGDADTDHRVDLYALGCVAYWLLTRKMVFEGENVMQVMLQHAQVPPTRPSVRVDGCDPSAARGPGHGMPGEGSGRPSGRARRRWTLGWTRFLWHRYGPRSGPRSGGRRTWPSGGTRGPWRMCSCRTRGASCG